MLSKIIGISAVTGLLIAPSSVDAHHRHKVRSHKPVKTVTVTIEWAWVEATLFRSAHWHHPHHGRSHRDFTEGPPPHRPNAHATWAPGHWVGMGRHRHWVPGHWRR